MGESLITRKGGGGGIINENYVEQTATVRANNNIKKGQYVEKIVTNWTAQDLGWLGGSSTGNAFDSSIHFQNNRFVKINERLVLFFYFSGAGGAKLRFRAITRDKNNVFSIKNEIMLFSSFNIAAYAISYLSNNTFAVIYTTTSGTTRSETRLVKYDVETNTVIEGAATIIGTGTADYFLNGVEAVAVSNNRVIYAYRGHNNLFYARVINYNTNTFTVQNFSAIPSTNTSIADATPINIGILWMQNNENTNIDGTIPSSTWGNFVVYTTRDVGGIQRWSYSLNSSSNGTSSITYTDYSSFASSGNSILNARGSVMDVKNSIMGFLQGRLEGNGTDITVYRLGWGGYLTNGSYSENAQGQSIASNLYTGVRVAELNEHQGVLFLRNNNSNLTILNFQNIRHTWTQMGTFTLTNVGLSTSRFYTFTFADGTTLITTNGTSANSNFFLRVLKPTIQVKEYVDDQTYKPHGIAQENGGPGQFVKIVTI